eukprot:gene35971-46720_t
MAKEGSTALNRMLGNIDCRRSECWKEEDRVRIFSVVENTVGFDTVNSTVFALMRDWVVVTAEASVLEAGEDKEKLAAQQAVLAGLYQSQGKYDDALPLYESALSLRREVLGLQHPKTISGMCCLAGLYESQGRYDEAGPLYESALAIRRQVLGPQHPDTIISMKNLAMLYKSLCRYDEAASLEGILATL